jgi:hypothetical protein
VRLGTSLCLSVQATGSRLSALVTPPPAHAPASALRRAGRGRQSRLSLSNSRRPSSPTAAEALSPAVFAHTHVVHREPTPPGQRVTDQRTDQRWMVFPRSRSRGARREQREQEPTTGPRERAIGVSARALACCVGTRPDHAPWLHTYISTRAAQAIRLSSILCGCVNKSL